MDVLGVARIAIELWPQSLAVTMTAVAGAESGWNPEAGGDTPRRLRELGHNYEAALAETYNCPLGSPDGPASWGLWQIFMPYHLEKIRRLGGPVGDPCQTAAWLKDPWNNARTANEVLLSQGLEAWATYRSGAWMRYEYLEPAREAVAVLTERRESRLPLVLAISGLVLLGGYIVLGSRAA